jgi:hypothetical protein
MQTRRSSKFSSLIHVTGLFSVTALLALAGACDSGGDEGDADEAGDGDGDNGDGDGDGNTDNAESGDGSSEACEGACANLESCGLPTSECLMICFADECATCLANSNSCGEDCLEACAPVTDTGDGDGDTTGDGDGDTGVPETECVLNTECGISFECVACGLTDNEGWCVQSSECSFDDDCGIDGKCGYNVETSDYRCLPESYCP